ncbi:MAG: glycoside hydrolase family 78 protein [Clostridiales bacterium]|jgi:alpha-L-rhamnosidase|nr:glycoside hydrolase family 78 protein [Clostridiales bacterium]
MSLTINGFTIDYRTGGIGLSPDAPVFSWKLDTDAHNTVQSAYRLRVSGGGAVYDTGRVDGAQSVCVPYKGARLSPQTEYRAEVEVTDNHGNTARAALTFETGLGAGADFTADFITADTAEPLACFEVFKGFSVGKKVVKARAYATAFGLYTLQINGKRAGDAYLTPGWTSYNKMLEYQTYDVTALVAQGGNEVALTVAKGWYAGYFGFAGKNKLYGDVTAAFAELHLFYEDGSRAVVKTAADWQARRSFITDSEIYYGETQDFCADVSAVFPVKTLPYDKNNLVAQINEPCRVTERVKPVGYLVTPKGERVLDFGQNLVGVVELKINGKKGQTVTLKHAEILDRDGNFYTANLRTAKSTDTFVLRGGEQVVSPVFTFHGFRFLQVIGAEVNPDDYTALVIHSDMTPAGSISTSNALINKLFSNIRWGQRGNFVDIPTDCPQRDERLGWTGDINAFCRTATFNYNVAPFLSKWLRDIENDQRADGSIPVVIPDIFPREERAHHMHDGTQAMWSSAVVMVPWTLYNVYGDERFITRQYSGMRKFIDKLLSMRGGDGLIHEGPQYADWLSLDGGWTADVLRGLTDHYYIANVFCLIVTDILVKSARILGNTADGDKYEGVYNDLLSRVRRTYFTPAGRMVTETQTACALALHFNIAPEELRPQIVALLENAMLRYNGKLTTGFIGTPFLCFALSDNGLHAYTEKLLLTEEYPGWLYPIKLGATTIWERWNSLLPDGVPNPNGMNSYNHYAYGCVGEFYWRRVIGIDSVSAGYKKIRIAPHPVKGIDKIHGAYESVYGVIAAGYEVKDGKTKITVKIPANTTAEIVLPGSTDTLTVGSGAYEYDV